MKELTISYKKGHCGYCGKKVKYSIIAERYGKICEPCNKKRKLKEGNIDVAVFRYATGK